MADEEAELAEHIGAFRRAALPGLLLQVARGFDGVDLSVVQVATLYLLESGRSPTVRMLAERIDRSVSATSRLVDQLVVGGLVDRREDPADRRARRLGLTGRGHDVLRRFERTRANAQLALTAHLTRDEQRTVAEAMALLAKAARSHTDG
ncbi:MAG TPA: MarR family transcriptional regulator [Pseudonocardia sp.]